MSGQLLEGFDLLETSMGIHQAHHLEI